VVISTNLKRNGDSTKALIVLAKGKAKIPGVYFVNERGRFSKNEGERGAAPEKLAGSS